MAVWLFTGCFLIFVMVVVGGITRLTGSGLSITEWNVIMGTLPPLNESQWNEAFEKYRQIPQFTEINSHFQLSDFKSIFWWEYIHRLIGRLLGVVFILPFLYFLFTKQLDRKTLKRVLFLFFLGGLQGFLGWFMVKSGLTERTSVSHIRLAIHLITAFITFGFTLWFALGLWVETPSTPPGRKTGSLLTGLVVLIILQIIYGALVAGLHAGWIYNTYPLMNGKLLPEGVMAISPSWKNFISNPGTVQFIHRTFALAILFFTVILWIKLKRDATTEQLNAIYFLIAAVAIQFLLGIITLLTHVPLGLASLHQAGAFFLFASAVFLLFRYRSSDTA